MLLAFNKPYGVLSQFTDEAGHQGLKHYIDTPNIYAVGRLDHDSEGLLLLSDDGAFNARMSHPRFQVWKTYLAQVDGLITGAACAQLAAGVALKDGLSLPARAVSIGAPAWLWPRLPPIRQRASLPTSWLQLSIQEGRNRQVRRMSAAVGFPTLRLIRIAIGEFQLGDLAPGHSRVLRV
jgi:23S rRNA pseudouridine2457 synthase